MTLLWRHDAYGCSSIISKHESVFPKIGGKISKMGPNLAWDKSQSTLGRRINIVFGQLQNHVVLHPNHESSLGLVLSLAWAWYNHDIRWHVMATSKSFPAELL